MPEEKKSFWEKVGGLLVASYNFIKSSRRRIAIISSALTTVGGLVGSTELIVIGTLGTAIFGGLDAKDNLIKKMK